MELSITQASQKANVTEATIRNWIKSGKLEARKDGKTWKISEKALKKQITGPVGKQADESIMSEENIARIAGKVVEEIQGIFEQTQARQAELAQASETLRKEHAELQGRVAWLENEMAGVKDCLKEFAQQARQPEKPAKQDQRLPGKPEPSQEKPTVQEKKAEQPQEETAEKWARENAEKWLDEPCQYGKAKGRTWRQLAENQGTKIEIKGVPSLPRAYLHAIESWHQCESVWAKMKAKVALEVVRKETETYHNHYNHPAEHGF